MNRTVQAILLFLVGGVLLHAGATGLYLRYVKAGLRPLVLAAGVVLVIAAVATVWYARRRPARHPAPRVSWLLVLPVFALVLAAPPALGSYSAMRAGTAVTAPRIVAPLPDGNPVSLTVIDYADRAVYDQGRSLAGRTVTLTGFVAFDHAGVPYLVRMLLNCCAADAQPVKVGLAGAVPPVLQPDSWLEVTGTFTAEQAKDPVNGGAIPFVDVGQARPVPPPADPYESRG
ncbi:TIGR03943 family putative permease subunit [Amycolatopsis vastitatis]|uniref:TIGR03943 family protein n=1 Tax=Amycolatopsis vastitatis TaxID=1905142 RepID=A0A229SXG4_9PSEU|nr:TIGR03943 family protein [Amycolatopsis vastitatis]OXM63351.1 TIGR03943 family protein [Amycolatopsis vastitatis]